MRHLTTMFALTACLGLAALAAKAKPSFAGDWKLNAAKSDFGQFPAPSALSEKITHDDAALKTAVKMTTDQGAMDFDATYKMDGTETSNQFGPSEMKSKAAWDGDTLVIDTKGQFGDTDVTMKDKWDLSADGKTITISRHFSSSMGEMDQKLVLEKQ